MLSNDGLQLFNIWTVSGSTCCLIRVHISIFTKYDNLML